MLKTLVNSILQHRLELIVIVVVLLFSAIAHGYNMFGFPYYENDEGVYLSQALSIIQQGKLAPYTYWYDHAPAGWVIMSVWILITKSVFLFGSSLNSGRVFMLLIHLASTLLLLRISKKLTGTLWVGIMASILFSLSPLGLYFQRRILLDNIMIFWILWAYCLILGTNLKLSHYIWSAVFVGIAVLTKENAIFFIPGYLCTMYFGMHTYHKRFALVHWMLIVASVISTYFLFALLKGELFPYGSFGGGSQPHVSLLGTLSFQLNRSGGSDSGLMPNFMLWLKQDTFLITAGIFSNIVLLVLSFIKSRRSYAGLALFGLFFWIFLMRGGIVIEIYIVPLLPLMALYISLVLYECARLFHKLIPRLKSTYVLASFSAALLLMYAQQSQISRSFGQNNEGYSIFTSVQTEGQIKAIDWIRKNIDPNAVIIIDNYSYIDLRDASNSTGVYFKNAHWYWKVNQDSEVKNGVLNNSPEEIDFVAATPQMRGDLMMGISTFTTHALEHATLVKGFNTFGWGVEIWATQYPKKILKRTWDSYKKYFMINGNQSRDPNANNITTSEGQSYILLRSVWSDDKQTFQNTWDWTKSNLMNKDGTISWKWGGKSGQEGVLDEGSATDADTDVALALLFAYKRWGDSIFYDDALRLLKGIWNNDTRKINGKQYVIPGKWAADKKSLIINPSYLSPYAYRIFALADPSHPWIDLIGTSYELLHGCMSTSLFPGDTPVHLPPNWCQMSTSGVFSASNELGLESSEYSYDAVRTMWRLAVDYTWNKDTRALKLLNDSSSFLLKQWDTNGKILVGYTHGGKAWEEYESVLGYATALSNFAVTNQTLAKTIYTTKIHAKLYEKFEGQKESYWENPQNYYIQNWAWFGTALYANALPNLWNK